MVVDGVYSDGRKEREGNCSWPGCQWALQGERNAHIWVVSGSRLLGYLTGKSDGVNWHIRKEAINLDCMSTPFGSAIEGDLGAGLKCCGKQKCKLRAYLEMSELLLTASQRG